MSQTFFLNKIRRARSYFLGSPTAAKRRAGASLDHIKHSPLALERLEHRTVLTSFLSGPWGWVGAFAAIASDTATDAQGNVYVVGGFSRSDYNGPLDFDPGENAYSVTAQNGTDPAFGDGFIVKFNSDGQFQWLRTLTVQWGSVGFSNIDIVSDGSLRVTGSAYNQHVYSSSTLVAYTPAPTSSPLLTIGPGQTQPFACKLTDDGQVMWTSPLPRSFRVEQNGTAVNPTNDSILLGCDAQSIYQLASDGTVIDSPLPYTTVVDSYGTRGYVRTDRMGYDNDGNMFLAGAIRGIATFGLTGSVTQALSTSQMGWNSGYTQVIKIWSTDVFIAKYSPGGSISWVRVQGDVGPNETLECFAVGAQGTVLAATSASNAYSTRTVSCFGSGGELAWSTSINFDSTMQGLTGLTFDKAEKPVLVTRNGLADLNVSQDHPLTWRNRIYDGNVMGAFFDRFNRVIVWSVGPLGYGQQFPSPRMDSSGAFPRVWATYNNGAYSSYPGTYFAAITEPAVPASPSELHANPSNYAVQLDWAAPTYNGGPSIIDYVIQYSSDFGRTWRTFDDGVSVATSGAVTGLDAGVSYVFRVAAVNGVGRGAFTADSSRTIPTEPLVIETASGATANDHTSLAGAVQLLKRGIGTLVLNAASSHFGGTVVEAGTIVVRSVGALGTGPVVVKAGSTLILDVAASQVPVVSLIVEPGAAIDLGYGQITVVNGDATLIRQAIVAARGNGSWSGSWGVTSRVPTSPRGVGLRRDGVSSYTIGYAASGDLNIDGSVDVLDIAQFMGAAAYNTGRTSWWDDGDFNYDGIVDIQDAFEMLVVQLFNKGSYIPVAANMSSVAQASSDSLSMTDLVFAALAVETTESASSLKKRQVIPVHVAG